MVLLIVSASAYGAMFGEVVVEIVGVLTSVRKVSHFKWLNSWSFCVLSPGQCLSTLDWYAFLGLLRQYHSLWWWDAGWLRDLNRVLVVCKQAFATCSTSQVILSTCAMYLCVTVHSVEQDVEWAYCWDVHCNAFFPTFLLLHVVQYFLLHILMSDR